MNSQTTPSRANGPFVFATTDAWSPFWLLPPTMVGTSANATAATRPTRAVTPNTRRRLGCLKDIVLTPFSPTAW